MVAVIGDIHGCFNTLMNLYEKVVKKYPGVPVYCVGDLVDRGNFSCQVIDFVIDKKIKFVPGNHDMMFYDYYQNPSSIFARSWEINGNKPTIKSYKMAKEKLFIHLMKISEAPFYYDLEDCFITHAGIPVNYLDQMSEEWKNNFKILYKAIEENINEDYGILWNREELINIGKLQILGHTKTNNTIYNSKANALYLDTGAYEGNKLSCVVVKKNKIVEILSKNTHEEDINSEYIL